MIAAMKVAAVALVVLTPAFATTLRHAGGVERHAASKAKVIVLPEDQEECVQKVSKYIEEPVTKRTAISKATDDCAVSMAAEARNYVCRHVKDALRNAFAEFPDNAKMSADKFCEMSEFHVLRLRGTTRVPNVGSGSILNFTIGEDCEPAVLGAMKPREALPGSDAGDFWYSLCVNQDCAHFLPSRTRWCRVDRQPTHGIEVCRMVREFAAREVGNEKELSAQDLCGVYDHFVEDVKSDVEAYDHYMHEESREHVETPQDHDRALGSARMLNTAMANRLRDGMGHPVKAHDSGAVHLAPAGVLAAVLANVALAA